MNRVIIQAVFIIIPGATADPLKAFRAVYNHTQGFQYHRLFQKYICFKLFS